MKNEPLVTRAGVVAIVSALVSVGVAFGLNLDKSQQAAVLGLASVLAPLIVAAVTHHKVTPYHAEHVADN